MATVPNRYYNSPWIAQAAQNLASALYPDPMDELRSLQMQHTKAQMDREARAEAYETDLRTRTDAAMADLASAFEGVDYDAQGQPLPKSMNAIAARVARVPGAKPESVYSPFWRGYTTGMTQAGQTERNTATNVTNERIQTGHDTTNTNIATARNASNERIQTGHDTARKEIAAGSDQARLDAARIGVGGKPPRAVDRQTREDIALGLDALATETGYPMTPEMARAMQAEVEKDWQITGSVGDSLLRKWQEKVVRAGGYNTQTMPKKGVLSAILRGLHLGGNTQALTLGEVASGSTAAQPEQPQVATQTVETPAPGGGGVALPGAGPMTPPIQLLKEGVATKFANGETWTLQAGQPVRLAP